MTFDFCSLEVILFSFAQVRIFAYFYDSKFFSFLTVYRPYCYYQIIDECYDFGSFTVVQV
jgi:hypothetical protein